MTNYLLSVHYIEGAETPSDAQMAQMYTDVEALNDRMKREGAWVFAGGLHEPTTATVVRVEDDEALTTDGPFPEAKEHIAGIWIIDVADLDAALGWAEQATRACRTPVEVRPFQDDAEVEERFAETTAASSS